VAYDPSYPTIDKSVFKPNDWKSFYGNVEEPTPSNAPEPRGKDVDLRLYVDSDHAGEKRTRRSHSGFFVFMNTALVQWFSKQQATIDDARFGNNEWGLIAVSWEGPLWYVSLQMSVDFLREVVRRRPVRSGPVCTY
jgi:hypothetical protein